MGVPEPLVPVVGEYGAPEIVLGAHIVNWSNKVTKAATILNLKQNNARLEKVHKLLAEKCHVIERIYRINKADCIVSRLGLSLLTLHTWSRPQDTGQAKLSSV